MFAALLRAWGDCVAITSLSAKCRPVRRRLGGELAALTPFCDYTPKPQSPHHRKRFRQISAVSVAGPSKRLRLRRQQDLRHYSAHRKYSKVKWPSGICKRTREVEDRLSEMHGQMCQCHHKLGRQYIECWLLVDPG